MVKNRSLKNIPELIVHLILLLVFVNQTNAQKAGNVTIIDSRHYSEVFGEVRNYRIFLPPDYYNNPNKKYPVIYFYHGWAQRYFGSASQYADYDKGDENKGDNISNFVSSHDVIVVKPDGYNRRENEDYFKQPYNVEWLDTYRQYPIYFPEFVDYIDTHYHTIADRDHRAISGLSMGGFMAFWIGGKYPHLVSAAGSFCGSAEFLAGPVDFPFYYRHIDMYKNYGGMNVRLNYGDKDRLRGFHQELNKVWPQVMDNYEFKIYDAGHSTCGLGDLFSFLLKTFENPPIKPLKWNHIDVYPEFSVWDYKVSTDRNVPGVTILENVDKRGFRCTVREFLPDGEILPFVNLSITTPALYEKNQFYTINDVDIKELKTSVKTIRSDNTGRLAISTNGSAHEIGINKKGDNANICIASVETGNMSWAVCGKEVSLSIKILNNGLSLGKNISATLSATRRSANVIQNRSEFGNIGINEIKTCQTPYSFLVKADSIEIEKFKLTLRDENKNEWVEFFEIPLKKDVPEIKDFEIADGKIFTVVKGGNDYETVLLGHGNGDGIANPGESIILLVEDQDKYWRTALFSSDEYVNPSGINMRKLDDWDPFNSMGAYTEYNVPLISSGCPEDHVIEFFARYWLPDSPFHSIKQGVIKITVTGKDITSPQISFVQIPGDNVIHVKVYDGSKIQYVKARLILKGNPEKSFVVELNDDGIEGDQVKGDNVFSKKIPEQKFGFYRVVVEAMDYFGNKTLEESPKKFTVY